MRILHVLDHGLPLHSGYTFRTRAIVGAQLARGLEVRCLTGARHSAPGPDPETIDGIIFHRTPSPAPAPSPLREWREIKALEARLEALVDEWRPDQLHVHSPVLNALAALAVARRRGLPLLYEIRAFWEDAAVGNGTGTEGSPRYRLTRSLETWAARRADSVAVICEGLPSPPTEST
jgi:glycosyltransferase involved in cell wall biosynthesis